MYTKLFILIIIITVNVTRCFGQNRNITNTTCSSTYCYDLDIDKSGHSHFGCKAPYPRYTDFDVNRPFTEPNCKPIQIWLLVRHAARFPSIEDIKNFGRLDKLHDEIFENYKNHSNRMCKMCDADLNLLKRWKYKNKLNTIERDNLVDVGYNEMIRLGENYRKMFPTLFDGKFSNETYLFGFATENRTRFSYYGFLNGIFGVDNGYKHVPLPKDYSYKNDSLLQPYAQCKASVWNAKKQDSIIEQAGQLIRSKRYQQLINEVSLRLGYQEQLKHHMIDTIWQACKFEHTWQPLDPSAWCTAFLPHHYEMLEYYDDVKFYYKKSYGVPMTQKLACTAVNNALYHLTGNQATVAYKVIAYFIHSTLMQLFLTALGLYRDDEHLTASNYDRMLNRKFKSSDMIPMSANFAIVKFHCSHKPRDPFQVMFFQNQRPLKMDWCSNGHLCSMAEMVKRYEHFGRMDCNVSFCDGDFKGFDNDKLIGRNRFNSYLLGTFILFLILFYVMYYFTFYNPVEKIIKSNGIMK